MNREIKFRIWDKQQKKFHIDADWGISLQGSFIIGFASHDSWNHDKGYKINLTSQDNMVVQQYTGVQDKNKKDVYDGDILRNQLNGNYCYVRWACDMEYAGWSLARPDEPIGNLFLNKHYKNLEVVGNIFENPELLKH
jgi:uncharacterized phage protein (TIGR01671 family)